MKEYAMVALVAVLLLLSAVQSIQIGQMKAEISGDRVVYSNTEPVQKSAQTVSPTAQVASKTYPSMVGGC